MSKKVHYRWAKHVRGIIQWSVLDEIQKTRDITEVTCQHCLKDILRRGLRPRSEFPEIPTFEVVVPKKHPKCCYFVCPVCGFHNNHGRGEGHRVSHCGCWEQGYYLEEMGGP